MDGLTAASFSGLGREIQFADRGNDFLVCHGVVHIGVTDRMKQDKADVPVYCLFIGSGNCKNRIRIDSREIGSPNGTNISRIS